MDKMSNNVKTLLGYISVDPTKGENASKRKENADGDVTESEDEIDEDDIMEMHDISAVIGGAFQSNTRSVACKTVMFCYGNGEKAISGPFLFLDTWFMWEMEVEVNMKTLKVQHTPRYRIKPKWRKQDVDQYLKMACDIQPQEHFMMLQIVEKIFGQKDSFLVNEILELTSLEEKINEGGAMFSNEERNVYKLVQQFLSKSSTTALIQRAVDYPQLFWKLQAILPKKAFGILRNKSTEPGSLRSPDFEGLNKAVEESPWEFAFYYVLYKKYRLSGCEAKLSDLQKSGIFQQLDDVMKDNIIVYNNLKNYCLSKGHTYINLPGKRRSSYLVQHHCKDRSKTQMFLCNDRTKAMRCEKRSLCDPPRLYLRKYWQAEKNIAYGLRALLKEVGDGGKEEHLSGFDLPPLEKDDLEKLDEDQRVAVENIRMKPLTILSGMGGCGKTTVVSKLVKRYCEFDAIEGSMKPVEAFSEPGDHCILLTAPTGKAAALLGKKCGLPACTIHSVIYSHMAWKMSQSEGAQAPEMSTTFEKRGWKFAGTKMLVVDECSMVGVTTFEWLLKILRGETSLCKVVLVGDIRQLPSVEPGNFFEDIFQVASKYSLGVDLKTNHRVDAGGKSIVKNAKRISLKKMPKFDEETFGLPERDNARFRFLEIDLEEGKSCDDALRRKARDATMERVESLLNSDWSEIEDHTTSQFITFTRSLVADANQSCCEHYNHHYTHKNGKRDFKIGDKICCRKNCKIDNPFHEDKVGDANTGAGFAAGKHSNRKKNDDVLSPEEALKCILGDNQEKTERENDELLSHGRDANRSSISPDQLEYTRLAADGKTNNIKFEGIEMEQGPEEHVPMELTGDKITGDESTNLDSYQGNKALERDMKTASDPGVSDDCASAICEESTSEEAKGVDDCIDENVLQSTEVGKQDGMEEDKPSYRICNGDTFIIKEMKDFGDDSKPSWREAARLYDMDSRHMWVDFSSFRRTGKAEHAWCRTIHTFQGSEVKTVVYLISSCKSESWKHVYTAVTRGKEQVVVIGPRKYLREALLKDYIRNTGLKRFFQKEMENLQWQSIGGISDTDGSRAEWTSPSKNSDIEMEKPETPVSTSKFVKDCVEKRKTLSSFSEVDGRGETDLWEVDGEDDEDNLHHDDNLPFQSYHKDLVAEEPSHSDRELRGCSRKGQQTSLPRTQFTEVRDITPFEKSPLQLPGAERYPSNSEGFEEVAGTVKTPSKQGFSFKNRRESSILNSPSPSQMKSKGRTMLPDRQEQEVEYFGRGPSPSNAMDHSRQPLQAAGGSPSVFPTCPTQIKNGTPNKCEHSVAPKPPPADSLSTTPGGDETDLGPESEEFEKLSFMSPMDTGDAVAERNRAGARKRLNYQDLYQGAAKSPKK